VWLLFLVGTTIINQLSDTGKFVDRNFSLVLVVKFFVQIWQNKLDLLGVTWPLLLPVLGFIANVARVGSIVLGINCVFFVRFFSFGTNC
jgi:hypothetical protein